jgi:uroporphyrinogen decarboxylase
VLVDLGATPSSGISAIAYGRLKRHLGLKSGHNRVDDVVQQLAEPEECIFDRSGIDVVDLGRTFNTSDEDWYEVKLCDGSRAQYPEWFRPEALADDGFRSLAPDGVEIAVQLKDMNFYDQTCFPWIDDYPADFAGLPAAMGKVHWAALAHSPWDHAGDSGFWESLRANTLALRRQSDRAIMVVLGCNLFEWGTFLRRMDNFLMDLIAESEHAENC